MHWTEQWKQLTNRPSQHTQVWAHTSGLGPSCQGLMWGGTKAELLLSLSSSGSKDRLWGPEQTNCCHSLTHQKNIPQTDAQDTCPYLHLHLSVWERQTHKQWYNNVWDEPKYLLTFHKGYTWIVQSWISNSNLFTLDKWTTVKQYYWFPFYINTFILLKMTDCSRCKYRTLQPLLRCDWPMTGCQDANPTVPPILGTPWLFKHWNSNVIFPTMCH